MALDAYEEALVSGPFYVDFLHRLGESVSYELPVQAPFVWLLVRLTRPIDTFYVRRYHLSVMARSICRCVIERERPTAALPAGQFNCVRRPVDERTIAL